MGSGTIFFAQCNLRCVFARTLASAKAVISLMSHQNVWRRSCWNQEMGCHNINFVTPSHIVHKILEALPLAVETWLADSPCFQHVRL